MKRIAIVPVGYLPRIGGAEMVIHNLAIEHQRAGCDVTVVPNLASVSIARHLPYRCVPMWRRAWSTAVADGSDSGGAASIRRGLRWRVALLQRLLRPQVWHLHAAYPLAWAMIDVIRRDLCVPVVVSSHGSDIYDIAGVAQGRGPQFDHEIRRRIESTVRRADGLIAFGPGVVDAYRAAGADEEQIWLIPHGWDRSRVHAARRHRDETRRRLGVTTDRVVLTVAADRPEKRIDDALAAAATLKEPSAWTWVIATVGGRVAEEVARLELGGRVVVVEEPPFRGPDFENGLPRQSLLDLYAVADLLVVPSAIETAPTVVHEAFTSGCPVVANVDSAAGLIAHDRDGLIVDTSCPGKLVETLESLDSDPARLARLRAGAQAHGSSFDDWEQVARRHREVYDAVGLRFRSERR